MKDAKRGILTAIIVITLAFLTAGCSLLSPLMVIAEDNARKSRMDNPYVNSNYAGWNRVAFFEKYSFELPEFWYSVQLDDSTYALYQDETVIAYFGRLGGDSKYDETADFCAAMVGSVEIASPYEHAGTENYGNGCYASLITVTYKNTEQEKYYYLDSNTIEDDFGMLFLNDGIDQSELLDFVVAIGYSYELR